MYEETDPDGRRAHTVAAIAAEFGVTRPTVYRHLAKLPAEASWINCLALFLSAGNYGRASTAPSPARRS